VSVWIPASLRITVLLLMLGFAAILSAVNLLYHVPRAEHVAQDNAGRQFAQDMSRLQSTLEYLLLKGELVIAQHHVSVLAHNHDYRLVVLVSGTTSGRLERVNGQIGVMTTAFIDGKIIGPPAERL
jgi:two-component system NtrC family sensor kinase